MGRLKSTWSSVELNLLLRAFILVKSGCFTTVKHYTPWLINAIDHNASVQHRKSSPDRKLSPMWTTNDPAGKRRMAWSYYYYLFILFSFIYFLTPNDNFKINVKKRY